MTARTAEGIAHHRQCVVLLFVLLFSSYAYFFQGGGWNANARLDLTRALVEQRSIAIDEYRHNTGDWAFRAGHYYSNKAPGISVLAVPFHVMADAIGRALGIEADGRLRLSGYLATVGVNATSGALLGLLVFHVLGRLGLRSAAARAALALALGLGTPLFPYATAFYAHTPAAFASFAAFAALLEAGQGPGARRWALGAGALGGLAVVLENSTALVVGLLGLTLCFERERRRLLPWFVAGGLPLAVALGGYHWLAFGHPLATGYDFQNPGAGTSVEGRLFGLPTPGRIYALTFSEHRGLFFVSPLLALAPFGLRRLYASDRRAALVCAGTALGFLLVMASWHAWRAGFSAGPRLLVPSIPFWFVPAALAATRVPRLATFLAVVSVGICLAVTIVTVELPPNLRRPIRYLVLPHLLAGHVSINPYGLEDFAPPPVGTMNSFNLGEWLWPERLLSVAPLLGLWAVVGPLLLSRARSWDRERAAVPSALGPDR